MRGAFEATSSSANYLLTLKFMESSLRLSSIPLTVASIWVTVTNKQEDSVYGSLDFKSFSGLKYMVFINAICACYAFLAIIFSWLKGRISDWLFFLSDQVLAYLLVTSGAAVIEILYLAYRGDKDVTWSEACSIYGDFCNKMKTSLLLQMVALLCFFVLSVISAHRVFSKFEAPFLASKEGEQQQE